MNKQKYFIKTAISTMLLFSLVGCGQKVEQAQTSSSNDNVAIENKPSSNESENNENKPVESNKQELKEIKIDVDLKKKLDIFFSNFSEANVKPFEKDKIDESSLISFGIRHIMINNFKTIEFKGENSEAYIKVADVDNKISYYFGKQVKQHKTVDRYTFVDGYYKFTMASGDGYTFSQIDKLYDLGNNKYKAEVSIYTASSGYVGDSHGTIDEWKATGDEVPKLTNTAIATIEKINENGNERYILIDYK